jgi:dTDP-4-dehydrorhamnose 3,5-epimerase
MLMKIIDTTISDLKIIEPNVFGDDRGFFFESFNSADFNKTLNLNCEFVQDNHSKSVKGVLRGLHYQLQKPQGKLVRVIHGEIFDVAVDIRKGSDTFGKWFGVILSGDNKKQLWVPEGFAHGFLVLSDTAEVIYKTTDYYAPLDEYSINWEDKTLGIEWPKLDCSIILSKKDSEATTFANAVLT